MMNEEMEPTTNTSETTEPVSAEHESVEASQPEDLALQIGRAILNDPHTVLPHFASQLGYQLVPVQSEQPMQSGQTEQPPSLGPWEQVLASVVLKMWASEASQQLEELARQDNIELSDQDIQQIFLDALERYQGDVETAYARFVLPRLRSRQNQPKQAQEQDVESPGDLIAAIHQAGYR